jgi:hypothetical protein
MAQRILALRKEFSGDSDTNGQKILDSNTKLYEDLFKTKDMSIVSSSPKVFSAIHKDDFGDEFHISDAELDAYVDGFIDAVNEANVDTVITEYNKDSEPSFDDSGLDDDDIKLSLYRSFKSLYDKWISNSKIGDTSGYFFNNYGQNDDRSLFDHFNFVNRGGQDIGAKAVIDPDYLTTIADTNNGEGPTQPLYTLMANILSKNNFDFFPLPNYVRYTNDKEGEDRLKDMFRADSSKIETIASNPSFVCMYIGGNSRILDIPRNRCINNKINFDYDDDSFDIEDGTAIPKDISDGNGITAFKVRYGQESQSHFSSIELDQSEFKETQESLLVIDSLVKPKSDQTPTQTGKGNNIYDMFLTRGYTCGVTALGNAMIQPLMYFKLENVPMFRGSYLITNVTHTITPHKMDTVFKGTRQPFISTPIVEDPVSILDLILEQQETDSDGESKNLNDVQGVGERGPIIVGNLDPNSLVQTNTPPPTEAPKLKQIIDVMKNKKGVFYSKKLGNKYSNKVFSELREDLISKDIYKPEENYQILDGEFEVNIVGIRSFSQQPNSFDDFLCVFYVDPNGTETIDGKKWTYRAWVVTTEPGSTALGSNTNLGSAIVAEGQYIQGWANGRHRATEPLNNYSVIRNDYNILIYRDSNNDKWAQKDTKFLYVDTPGTNIHSSGPNDKNGKEVNGWSAGCQVFKNPKDFVEFVYITYFIAQNEKRGTDTTTLRLDSKGGCGSCSGFLSGSIPPELKNIMLDNTQLPVRLFNYTLLNSADFGQPSDIAQGNNVYENYINSGFHST